MASVVDVPAIPPNCLLSMASQTLSSTYFIIINSKTFAAIGVRDIGLMSVLTDISGLFFGKRIMLAVFHTMKFDLTTYLCFMGILALHFDNSTYLSSDARDVSKTISDITQAWLGESPHPFLTQKKTNIVSNPWLAMLLLAGDVQSNPGPGCSYPCTVCQRNVRDKDAAVSCDLGNGWSHTVCVGISDEEYGNLMDQNSFNFFCHKCTLAELPSYSSSPERELNDTDSTIDHI